MKSGIRDFIDHTSPGELVPYKPLLPDAAEIVGLDTEQKALVCYQCFPIVGAVPKEETFEQIFAAIQESQGAGRKALVHCMIGTGRTSESLSDHSLRVSDGEMEKGREEPEMAYYT